MKAPWLPVLLLACLTLPLPLPLHADTYVGGFWVGLGPDKDTLRPVDGLPILLHKTGTENSRREEVDDGDGGTAKAVVVYPDDPGKRLVVFTEDAEFSFTMYGVRIEGAENQWWLWGRTRMADLKPGLTVEELETALGGTFEFTGAGFDYGHGSETASRARPEPRLVQAGNMELEQRNF